MIGRRTKFTAIFRKTKRLTGKLLHGEELAEQEITEHK